MTKVPCPICKTLVNWEKQTDTRPFCSQRCRLIDLGEWLNESRRIPGEPAQIPDRNPHEDGGCSHD